MITPIQLELSLEDTNLVLEALGDLPYARVYRLIDTIQLQAQRQFEATGPVRPVSPVPADGIAQQRPPGPTPAAAAAGSPGSPS